MSAGENGYCKTHWLLKFLSGGRSAKDKLRYKGVTSTKRHKAFCSGFSEVNLP